ncbi:hypothetical protein ACED66_00520, partial [Vibrio splendidus]|uniref:hypothetical protein n=1 Tax=Vibrio splendidus TaxID=29497 RepID=UPI00352D778F
TNYQLPITNYQLPITNYHRMSSVYARQAELFCSSDSPQSINTYHFSSVIQLCSQHLILSPYIDARLHLLPVHLKWTARRYVFNAPYLFLKSVQ